MTRHVIPFNYLAYNFVEWEMPELKSPTERVIYTLKWHGLPFAAILYNMIEVGIAQNDNDYC